MLFIETLPMELMMAKERNWVPLAVKFAFIFIIALPIVDRPMRVLLGWEELSARTAVNWAVGSAGWLALVGLIYFIVFLSSGPDER
jgi:hypothetical protein